MTNEEYIGYRSNTEKPQENEQGCVTIYAERKSDVAGLGKYGGDAYPKAYENTYNKKIDKKKVDLKYGVIIAADGVGQGGYTHPSLKNKLTVPYEEYKKLWEGHQTNEKTTEYNDWVKSNETRIKLTFFLKSLYGENFLKDEEAVDYAVKSFSDVPQNGFFAANRNIWGKENDQVVIPFYERDSQSLGSRITCVGLFYKFRDWAKENYIDDWSEDNAAERLRDEIEEYLSVELKEKVCSIFDESDAPDQNKKNFYYLCSTVAMWFYVTNPETKKVSALALNCGDARCYTADLADGIRQISIDDAFEDGRMSAFVHYGKAPRLDKEYHDGKFHARIVNLDYPCALLACSDGVYDTCPTKKEEKNVYLPYSEANESNDFLFEVNLLDALRRCYSIEDFTREIVFNFYTQCNTQCGESNDAGSFETIKRDDSGTLAGKFFDRDSYLDLFTELRVRKEVPTVANEENATDAQEGNTSGSVQPETEAENQVPAVATEEGDEAASVQMEAVAENQASALDGEENATDAQEKASEVAPVEEKPKETPPTPKAKPKFEPKCLVGRGYSTTLDKLFSHLVDEYNKGNIIPYYPPHVVSSEDKYEETLRDYATGKFKSSILDVLISKYPSVYSEMKEHDQNSMWGIENAPLCSGFRLKTTLSIIVNLVAMLKKAIAVYNEVKSIDENATMDEIMDKIAKQYENESWNNVLAIPEVAERLKAIAFDGFVKQIENSNNKADDEFLNKYTQFTACFFGADLPEDYHHIIGAHECGRKLPTE